MALSSKGTDMKISFRSRMNRPASKYTTVGTVWKVIGIVALACSMLMVGAITKNVSLCCFAFAVFGTAFMMILPSEGQ
jgi:hypothetical protein